jgi:septal ring factor EnvC (AmiA/AmiB activator)
MTIFYVMGICLGGGVGLTTFIYLTLFLSGSLKEPRKVRSLSYTKRRLGNQLNSQKLDQYQREALKSKINECEEAINTLKKAKLNDEVQRELNKAGKTIVKALK